MVALASRVPPLMIVFMPVMGTVSAAAGVYFSGDSVSAYALFFLWPPFYSLYFLSRAAAAGHFALVVVFYGLTAVVTPVNGGAEVAGNVAHHYLIICGSLAVAAVLISLLRTRITKLLQQLTEAARSDLLTGLLNLRGFTDILDGELERARMGGLRVSVFLIDLSGIRETQKRIGQQGGEALLIRLASTLEASTRTMDAVARTGHSEFALAFPETDETRATMTAEQILSRLRRQFREEGAVVGASIGVATFPKHASSVEELMQAAASASEAAQALGGDRVVLHSTELRGILGAAGPQALREQKTHLATVLSLAEVMELRDQESSTHSIAVARYCELLAEELGLPAPRRHRLRLAGFLHDIGKVGIADSILEKPGPLSPSEWDEVRRHPELAGRILGARELADIREWIVCRHEQPDGHGYPRGLAGEEIPLESRILAVAESYDAITSDRPYRDAMSRRDAIEEMARYAGSQFDGAVLDALVRVLDRMGGDLKISSESV
ncbi:MAG: bifunctional diguanylate cyclase/phosphohydrolase [Solirubrobacterales bacterium]